MKKRLLSLLLALCLMVSVVPVRADAAVTYSVDDAIAYAAAHWNDGVGLCAEFVSRCVRAGGIDIKVITTTTSCANAITNATGVGRVELKLNSKGYATKALNGDNLAEGDVVIQHCKTHGKAPHIIFCAGYDSSGIAVYYAHNGAMNKKYYDLSVNLAYEHTTSCNMVGQVLHISELDNDVGATVTASWKNYSVRPVSIGNTDATLSRTLSVSGTSINNVTTVGIRLFDGIGNLVDSKDEPPTPKDGVINMWYTVNDELGYTLQQNTAYKYQFYAKIKGSNFYSPVYEFVTGPNQGYTVSFNANGGSCSTASKKVATNAQYGTLPTASRSGYTFEGWYTAASGGTEITADTYSTKTANSTLYAHWKPNTYTVTYDANGGGSAPVKQTKNHGEALTLSESVPVRFWYDFQGWSTSKDAASVEYKPGDRFAVNANTTLYAVWQAAETIPADETDGSYSAELPFDAATASFAFRPSVNGVYRFESTGDLDVEIGLYTEDVTELAFDDDGGDGRNFRMEYEFAAGTQYYLQVMAYFEPNIGTADFTVKRVYDITYDANGGSNAPAAQTKAHGETVYLSDDEPVRDGYTFLGWATDPAATRTDYAAGSNFAANEDTTLYAVWQGNTCAIVKQPQSVAVASGETAAVTVEAVGDGLTYTWYYKNSGATSFSKTTAFTGNTYSVTMSEARSGRQVYCIVADAYGNSVQTDTVTLSMKAADPVTIVSQSMSVWVPEGEKATVTLEAEGDGLTYTWYYRNPGSTSFSKTTAFTGNTYSVTMSEARNGRQVYCIVADAYGNSVQTDTVTLSMKAADPVTIVSQSQSVWVPEGEKAVVTVNAVGDGLTYKWYYKNPGATKYTYTSSFKGDTYSVTMNEERSGRYVYCKITDAYGNTVKSKTVSVNMQTPLEIITQPKSVRVAEGKTAKVTVEAQGDGLTYKWYYKNPGASKYTYTSSFTGNSYSITMSEARDGRYVYCRVYDKYGNSVKTNTVSLRMK